MKSSQKRKAGKLRQPLLEKPLLKSAIFRGYGFPILVSVLLHALVVVVLLLNWSDQEKVVIAPPKSIKASVVEITQPKIKPKSQVQPSRDDKASKRTDDQARKKRLEDRRRKAEEKRKKEIALKRQKDAREKAQREKEEAERKEKLRQKKLAEDKRRKQQEAQKHKDQERLRAAQEQKARESALLAAAEQEEKDLSQADYYTGVLRGLVAQQWNRPPSARNNMLAVVQLKLSPFGDLLSVRLVTGSGDEAYDRSVIQAVKLAAPFPELKKLERRVFNNYFKTINFRFRPEDLVR
ncbi:hypothetical protein EOPP23_20345 [Endozoicomonas sp. OPT23]|uniref:cell envelope integrity protein TolA n=1 Tax=Endozoicomonas sp. OPT23 TaxID=2072845 RepID=UPI00129A3A6A|nr:cell envelope integrity protein TolA [Endozoicomonas sp. OPT23]MRI35312.1 hypothetical protein [Endozoicomonas sp. OPT23]